LGSQRYCNLNRQGPPGPQGPTGPAAVGPQGPTGPRGPTGSSAISMSINAASFASSNLTIPSQSMSIAYYAVTLSPGDVISQVLTTISNGYTAVVFIAGPTSAGSATIGGINGNITGINFRNLYTNTILQFAAGQPQNAILKITNINGIIYGEVTPMYNT